MPTKKKSTSLTGSYKKQHGIHHKHNSKYLKVYYPYLPLVLFVLTGIITSLVIFSSKTINTNSTPTVSTYSVLNKTNKARSSDKLTALVLNSELATAAQIKANDMAINNYWSPISPSGQTPWQIVKQTGYSYQTAGENLAYGFSSSSSLLNAWLSSPSHRANILNSNYKDIGIGVAESPDFQNRGAQTIIVAIYADPLGSSTSTNLTTLSSNTSQPFTTASLAAPHTVSVSKIEAITDDYSNSSIFIIGTICGIVICFLVVKHTLIFKKWALEGEQLIVKHPFLDVTLIIFIVGLASLNQTVGIMR